MTVLVKQETHSYMYQGPCCLWAKKNVYKYCFYLVIKRDNILFVFQEFIPTCAVLCNPGVRTRHWSKMSDIAGFDLTPDSGSTLRKVLKLNLGTYMEQFESISAAATKVWSSRLTQTGA